MSASQNFTTNTTDIVAFDPSIKNKILIQNFKNTGSLDNSGICTYFYSNKTDGYLAPACFFVSELAWVSFDSSRLHATITRISHTLLNTDYLATSLKSLTNSASAVVYKPFTWMSNSAKYLATIDYSKHFSTAWDYSTDYDARIKDAEQFSENAYYFATETVPDISSGIYQGAFEYADDKLYKAANIYEKTKFIGATIIERGGFSAQELLDLGVAAINTGKEYVPIVAYWGYDFVRGATSNIVHEPTLNHGRVVETFRGIVGEYPSVAEIGTMSGFKIAVNVIATKVFGMEVKSDPNTEKYLAEFAKGGQSTAAVTFGIDRGTMVVSNKKQYIEYASGFTKIAAKVVFGIPDTAFETLNTITEIGKKYADQTLHYGFNGDLGDFGTTFRKSAAGARVGAVASKYNKMAFKFADAYVKTLSPHNPIKIIYEVCSVLQCKEFLITTEMQWITRPFTYQINPKIHNKLKVIGDDTIVNRAEVLDKNLVPFDGNTACHVDDLIPSKGLFGITWLCATKSNYIDGVKQIAVLNPDAKAFNADETKYLDNSNYTILLQDDNSAIACHKSLVQGIMFDLKCVPFEV